MKMTGTLNKGAAGEEKRRFYTFAFLCIWVLPLWMLHGSELLLLSELPAHYNDLAGRSFGA